MSYDLTFLPKTDDQTWEEALDASEQRVVASMKSGAPSAGYDHEVWARLVAAAREELGEVEVFEGADHGEVSHDSGIQLSLYGDEAAITVPYWYDGEEADAVMARVFRLAAVVERETGLQGYDPQAAMPLAEAAAEMGLSRATFDRVAEAMATTWLGPPAAGPVPVAEPSGVSSEEPAPPVGPHRPWWRFW
ncbi:hypothetical protein GCM10028777_35900 [Angustibacter speluncae]